MEKIKTISVYVPKLPCKAIVQHIAELRDKYDFRSYRLYDLGYCLKFNINVIST